MIDLTCNCGPYDPPDALCPVHGDERDTSIDRTRLQNAGWLPVNRGDVRAFGISRRHYSITNKHPKVRQFIQAGSPIVLLTPTCDALFVWVNNSIERLDKQDGVICTIFRNEGPRLSSQLIEEADEIAWERWPGERHFYLRGRRPDGEPARQDSRTWLLLHHGGLARMRRVEERAHHPGETAVTPRERLQRDDESLAALVERNRAERGMPPKRALTFGGIMHVEGAADDVKATLLRLFDVAGCDVQSLFVKPEDAHSDG